MSCKICKGISFTIGFLSITVEQITKAIQEATQYLEQKQPNLRDQLNPIHNTR